jgi:2-phospho-L-lactate guanylyltransferase
MSWTILIPFKGASRAKSRLGADWMRPSDRQRLAEAFLFDVLSAAEQTPEVNRIVVTTPDPEAELLLKDLKCDVLLEPEEPDDLNASLIWALRELNQPMIQCAILASDLPYITSKEISAALALAALYDRSFVSDNSAHGTTMLFANRIAEFTPAFGSDSKTAHEHLGFTSLELPLSSGARHDVDTFDQLISTDHALGIHTRDALNALALD